ncbi:hypothetical protein FVE85_0608 [Porphyridium purpureum]|uniref:Uncharacterized protein n=1 Tax=Porphyridium purpureum TaxID=35688 RepID=A0A5J4YZ27_PORPP|nr:hypothetical protein FVE85_0608 [Porphyridium purpureum]|eukprot:POR5139..scf208_2
MIVRGSIELKPGDWEMPSAADLQGATLFIKINQAVHGFGGCGPSQVAVKQAVVGPTSFPLQYEITFEPPPDPEGRPPIAYSVSAVMNMGWCPEEGAQEWIRNGDWLTDTHFPLERGASDAAQLDIFLVHHPLRRSAE